MSRVFSVLTLAAVFLLGAAMAGAQEVTGFSLSLGPELNIYSKPDEGAGFGARLAGSFRFNESLQVSGETLIANDGVDLTTLEFLGSFRYYLMRSEKHLVNYYRFSLRFHIFVQAEVGGVMFWEETNRLRPFPVFGARGGVRIALKDFSAWYVEPYLRFGYPYIFGIGVLAVYRFPLRGVSW